jgi:tetratricopeptide (TPR) repeat protein
MKTIQKLLFLLLFIIYLNYSFSQEFDVGQKKADSILKLLPSQKDTTLFNSYINLFKLYYRKDPIKGKPYLDQAKVLAKKMRDNKSLGLAIYSEGLYYNNISEFTKAEELYREAIKIYTEAAHNEEMPLLYNSLGITLKNLGRTGQALEAYNKALEYNESVDSDLAYSYIYGNLGVLYAKMGNHKVSSEYYKKTEAMARALNSEYGVQLARSNRATNLVKTKDYQEALELYFGAIPFFEKQNRKLVLGEQYYLIGAAYLEMDSLEKAMENLNKSIALSKETEETAMLGMAKRKIGEVNFKRGNYREALREFEQSLQISIQTSNNIEIADDYLNLSDTYEKLGDVNKAYENRKRYFAVHDSVFSEESRQKLNDLEVRFKTEKSEQEVALQKKEIALLEERQRTANLQRIGLIAGIFVLILLFGLVYYGIRQKMKRNRLERERVKAELDFKKKELTSHALHLAKKNEVLEGLKQKAAELKKNEGGGKAYQELIRTINFDQQDDKVWENFTRYFEAVHKDFEKDAVSRYPDISKNELRLMALIKMNLSSKEIANILNISSDGVKKARQRLRKKMDLSPEDSLETTVMAI